MYSPQSSTTNEVHFSFSRLNAFLMCPAKFAHQYIWRTPWEAKPAALILGSGVHRGAQVFYEEFKKTGTKPPFEQIASVYETVLRQEFESTDIEISFKNGEDAGSLKQQGIDLLKLFHTDAQPRKIVAVEAPFSIAIPDLDHGGNLPFQMVGFLDLVEADEEGTYLIVELKTSGQRFSAIRLRYDLQSTVYSYAMSRMRLATSEESTLIRYDVLVKNKKPVFERHFITRTPQDHENLIHLINQVYRAITAEAFFRNTGWQCETCQFKAACLG